MWLFGDSACGDWGLWGRWPGGGVWIGPCQCCTLHHLLLISWGCFAWLGWVGVLLGKAEWHVCHCSGAGHSGPMEL